LAKNGDALLEMCDLRLGPCRETATNVSGGAQVSLGGDWYGGFGARYEKSNSDIDTRAEADGDYFLFAGALKGRWGDTTLTTVVTGGFGDFDMKRFINLPGASFTPKGDQDVDHGAVHARLDHSFLYNGWYVRPMVDRGGDLYQARRPLRTGRRQCRSPSGKR
jgi:hypothetical protein